jgi:hypothetical protein
MSPGDLTRLCRADLSRWSSAGRDGARPNPRSASPRSAPTPCCRATRASSSPSRGAVITPPAASSAAVASTGVPKSP